MLSKETQYRIFAGTRRDDYTGWERLEVDKKECVDYWSLDLGNGYYLDRVTKHVKGILGTRKLKFNSIRRDRTIEDPEGEYKDVDYGVLFDVDIMVSPDSIKFDGKHNSFVVLSREPADWEQFSDTAPEFGDKDRDENWSSFYS